jgi:hypothetical protein
MSSRFDFPRVLTDSSSPLAVGLLVHGVKWERTLYTAPVTGLSASGGIPWKEVADAQPIELPDDAYRPHATWPAQWSTLAGLREYH